MTRFAFNILLCLFIGCISQFDSFKYNIRQSLSNFKTNIYSSTVIKDDIPTEFQIVDKATPGSVLVSKSTEYDHFLIKVRILHFHS